MNNNEVYTQKDLMTKVRSRPTGGYRLCKI